MARVSYVEAETAPPEVKATYDAQVAATGWVSNLMKILAHYPKGMQATRGLVFAAREGHLDPKLRELAYLKVSRVNGCHYGFMHHVPFALKAGLTQQQIDGLDGYVASPIYDHVQKAVLRYAEEITRDAAAGDGTFQAVRKALGEREMVELTLNVALANCTNRLSNTFRPELESHF